MTSFNKTKILWTGLMGEADQEVRNIGKRFFVFIINGNLVITEDPAVAANFYQEHSYTEYVCMISLNEKMVWKYHKQAIKQWNQWKHDDADFLNTTLQKGQGSFIERKLDFISWAKEMEDRYGIHCAGIEE
jgi:hypothetical protein